MRVTNWNVLRAVLGFVTLWVAVILSVYRYLGKRPSGYKGKKDAVKPESTTPASEPLTSTTKSISDEATQVPPSVEEPQPSMLEAYLRSNPIVDAALLIAAATAILYIWGYWYYSAFYRRLSFPESMQEETSCTYLTASIDYLVVIGMTIITVISYRKAGIKSSALRESSHVRAKMSYLSLPIILILLSWIEGYLSNPLVVYVGVFSICSVSLMLRLNMKKRQVFLASIAVFLSCFTSITMASITRGE